MTTRVPLDMDAAASLVERVRAQGRTVLDEAEGMELLRLAGIATPEHVVLEDPDSPLDLSDFQGERVVVKLLVPGLAHRTEAGGVQIVERDVEAVRQAARSIQHRGPNGDARYLVADFVSHDMEPGGELLLSARWTEEFGAVVHLALGGVSAEQMSKAARPDLLGASFVAAFRGHEAVEKTLAGRPLGTLATGTGRGRTGRMSISELAAVVGRFMDLALATMPRLLTEVEVNPLTFVDGKAWALDALVRCAPPSGEVTGPLRGDAPLPVPVQSGRDRALHAMLHPESVAVLGASQRMNPGRVILKNLLSSGFPAENIQVVKPGLESLDGCRCVQDVESLDPSVDVLVVSVAAPQIPEVMRRVTEGRHARGVILIPGGLEEGGDNGGAEVRAMLGRRHAPLVNGANCLGIRSVPGRLDTLFIPPYKLGFPDVPPHPVAMLSQSGAFAVARSSALPWLNPRYLVTVGTQMDLTIGEYLEHLAGEDAVRVFACYVEGFPRGDGVRFLRAAKRIAASGRPVVLYRAGRTQAGKDATASHTASMAGDFELTRDLAGQAGVLVADSLEEFHDLVSLAVRLDGRRIDGSRVGAMSNAGFECVAMADGFHGIEAASFSEATIDALSGVLASHRLEDIVAPRNPLDVTPILSDASFGDAAAAILADDGVDVGVVGCVPLTPALHTLVEGDDHPEDLTRTDGVVARLQSLWRDTEKAWVCVVDAGPRYDAMAMALDAAGLPTFRSADRAVAALARYVSWRTEVGR